MNEAVRVARLGSTLEVTLNRPKANAIDAKTSRTLGRVFAAFRDDPELRVAIFTGTGKRFFSAGWDLSAADEGEAYESDYGEGGFGGFTELPRLNKPIIAAVNGIAAGGGFEIAMSADLVVAADHATFFLPEPAVGLIPDVATVRLPKLLPEPVAAEVLIAGRRLSAADALRFGLVNQVAKGEEVLALARGMADRITAMAPLAVAAIVDIRRRTEGMTAAEGLTLLRSGSIESYQRVLASEDSKEGPRAFVEKRAPVWRGR